MLRISKKCIQCIDSIVKVCRLSIIPKKFKVLIRMQIQM